MNSSIFLFIISLDVRVSLYFQCSELFETDDYDSEMTGVRQIDADKANKISRSETMNVSLTEHRIPLKPCRASSLL